MICATCALNESCLLTVVAVSHNDFVSLLRDSSSRQEALSTPMVFQGNL
jgi:hypothetical protein